MTLRVPAGKQVDPGQQTECAVALVFVVAHECLVRAGLRWQVGCRAADGLDTRLHLGHLRLEDLVAGCPTGGRSPPGQPATSRTTISNAARIIVPPADCAGHSPAAAYAPRGAEGHGPAAVGSAQHGPPRVRCSRPVAADGMPQAARPDGTVVPCLVVARGMPRAAWRDGTVVPDSGRRCSQPVAAGGTLRAAWHRGTVVPRSVAAGGMPGTVAGSGPPLPAAREQRPAASPAGMSRRAPYGTAATGS